MYSNVRGIKGKKSSIIEILQENDPQLFLLAETHLRTDFGVNIKGYTFFGRKRGDKAGGGVGILARNDILTKITPHISERDIELMWISIRRKRYRPLLIGIYYGKQECRTTKMK